jgi:hypothetical protein
MNKIDTFSEVPFFYSLLFLKKKLKNNNFLVPFSAILFVQSVV